jgi:hypothetical protein
MPPTLRGFVKFTQNDVTYAADYEKGHPGGTEAVEQIQNRHRNQNAHGVAVSGACGIIDTRKTVREDDYRTPYIRVKFYEDAGEWFYGMHIQGKIGGCGSPAMKHETWASYGDCRDAAVKELRRHAEREWDLKEKAVLRKLVRRFEDLSGYGGLFQGEWSYDEKPCQKSNFSCLVTSANRHSPYDACSIRLQTTTLFPWVRWAAKAYRLFLVPSFPAHSPRPFPCPE